MNNMRSMSRLSQFAVLCGIWFVLSAFSFGDPLYESIRQGNELYLQGQYDDAMKKYMEASQEDPLSKIVHYNMGNVWFMQDKIDNAIEEYEKALTSEEIPLQVKAYYNLGNCYVKKNDVLKAIDSYKQALKLDPKDEDAKFNLELIRRQLKSGPSEKALEYKKQVEELVKQRKYREANDLVQKAIQEEPTFQKMSDMIQRVKDLHDIFVQAEGEVEPI